MAEDLASAQERSNAAAALLAVLGSAFPAEPALAETVRKWIGYEAGPGSCVVCSRPHGELAVQAGARLQLTRGATAGTDAICGGCLDAAKETFGDAPKDGGPSWDMRLAQLERALALVSAEHASVARECLSKRPRAHVEDACLLCRTTKTTAHSGTKGVCEPCVNEARRLMGDLAARGELERDDSRCPKCGASDIAAGAVGIEFTELTCLSCGNSEICDVWQLSDWRR